MSCSSPPQRLMDYISYLNKTVQVACKGPDAILKFKLRLYVPAWTRKLFIQPSTLRSWVVREGGGGGSATLSETLGPFVQTGQSVRYQAVQEKCNAFFRGDFSDRALQGVSYINCKRTTKVTFDCIHNSYILFRITVTRVNSTVKHTILFYCQRKKCNVGYYVIWCCRNV